MSNETFNLSSVDFSKKKIMEDPPSSPIKELLSRNEEKKPSTKVMIYKALETLKRSRKGVSLYAIKKYMEDNYNVDINKTKHHIKRTITAGVEQGSIIQVKGTGASGSFMLGVLQQKTEQKKKPIKTAATKEKLDDAVEKPAKLRKTTEEKNKTTQKKDKAKEAKNKNDQKMQKPMKSKTIAAKKRDDKTKMTKSKTAKSKTAKDVTTKDVRTMRKRSIGSIIKKPKMKPGKV